MCFLVTDVLPSTSSEISMVKTCKNGKRFTSSFSQLLQVDGFNRLGYLPRNISDDVDLK